MQLFGPGNAKPPYISIIYELYVHSLELALSCVGGGMTGVSAVWEMKPQMSPVSQFWISLRSGCCRACSVLCPWPACAKLCLGSTLPEKYFSQDVNVPVGFPSLFVGMTPQRFCLTESAFFFFLISSPFLNVIPLSWFHTFK